MIIMTKTGSTKNKILNLLATGNKTLSDISAALQIAPSTANQHLNELKEMGAIRNVESDHIRKWKYYELNPSYNYNDSPIGVGIAQNKIQSRVFYYLIGLVAFAGVAYLFLSHSNNSTGINATIPQATNGTYVPVRLTDPPHVPAGTQSLVIAYSSVAVHTPSGWVASNSSGTIDLMSIQNVSQVIAGVKLPANSTIDNVRFNITSAIITINGTSFNVTVPNPQISAQISGSGQINQTNNLLIDMSPTVVAIYTNNSTVFVMVPSVKAVLTPGSAQAFARGNNVSESAKERQYEIGEKSELSISDINYLSRANATFKLSNAYLNSTNDSVGIRITVTNTGNKSVVLRNILVVGNQTPIIIYNNTCNNAAPKNGNPNPTYMWCRLTAGESGNSVSGSMPGNDVAVTLPHAISQRADMMRYESGYVPVDVSSVTALNASASGVSEPSMSSSITGGISTSAAGVVPSSIVIAQSQGSGGEWTQKSGHYDLGIPANSSGVHSGFAISVNYTQYTNQTLNTVAWAMINGNVLAHLMYPTPIAFNSLNATVDGHFRVMPKPTIFFPFYQRALDFIIESNGTLVLQNRIMHIPIEAALPMQRLNATSDNSALGYTLAPGQSVTFTSSSQVLLYGGIKIALNHGSRYQISVISSSGNRAVTDVNAS